MMALMALLASRGASGGMGGPMGSSMGGGLGGLVDMFRSRGHGDTIDSWVGHGPNRLMAPTELEDALGPETIDQLQQQTGMDRGDMLHELSHVLPGVVDQLTPHGRPPTDEEMGHW